MQRSSQISYSHGPQSQHIIQLLQNLNTRINIYLQEKPIDKLRSDILNLALQYLNKTSSNKNDVALLLDFYCTINSVFNICHSTSDLHARLRRFFAARENFLCGDSYDYCYQQTLANQFCQNIAQIAFPSDSPMNVLLHNARTQNRSNKWRDETTLEEDVGSPISFFRTNDNCIHLYEIVVDRAIANINKGFYELDDIWCGTDAKNLGPLTQHDLYILMQRSQALKQLIVYTGQLSTFTGIIWKRLNDLRAGLSAGAGGGYASSPAYLANQRFFNWWNNLQHTAEGTQLKSLMAQNSKLTSLMAFIENLKQTSDVCVAGIAGNLETILSSEQVHDAIRKIEGGPKTYLSGKELEQFRIQIAHELQTFKTITTNKNSFAQLSESKNFIDDLVSNAESMTYDGLIEWSQIILDSNPVRINKVGDEVSLEALIRNTKNMIHSAPPVMTNNHADRRYNFINYTHNSNTYNNQYPHDKNDDAKQMGKAHLFFRNLKNQITRKSNNNEYEYEHSHHHHKLLHRKH